MFSRIISILGIIIFLSSCAKEKITYEPSKKVDPFLLYNEAYESFEKNDFLEKNLRPTRKPWDAV